MAPWVFSKTWTHCLLSFGHTNDNAEPVQKSSFALRPRARYSAFAVGNVTHLCVLRAQLTTAPPRVINAPDTERLSFNVSATKALTYEVESNPEPRNKVDPKKPGPVKESHGLSNRLLGPLRTVVRVARHSTHRVPDVRPRHGQQPHQLDYRHPVRPVSSNLALLSWT